MARKPVPGPRLSNQDIDELEAAHGVEIPYRRSSPPPPAPATKTIEQIVEEADRGSRSSMASQNGF